MATKNQYREALNPVMLEFGATVYICQLLEESMCFLLALHECVGMQSFDSGRIFERSYEDYSKQIMGRMIKDVQKKVPLSGSEIELISTGIKKRNVVIHGFMTKNATRIITLEGRLEMIRELAQMREEIRSADMFLNKLIDKLLAVYGTSVNDFKEKADKYFNFANRIDYYTKH